MTVVIPSMGIPPPQGVHGAGPGPPPRPTRSSRTGSRHKQPNVCTVELAAGERIYGLDCGGGGYGNPLAR